MGLLALATGIASCVAPADLYGAEKAPAGIVLLPGYTVHQDPPGAPSWELRSPKGLRAYGEAGSSQGSWVDSLSPDSHVWCKEQAVEGWRMRVALVKPGAKTGLEDQIGRPTEESMLIVSFVPRAKGTFDYGANFVLRVSEPEDVVDMLLMMMTAKPKTVGS
jgi:hypothetical protein